MTERLWTERRYHPHARSQLRLAAAPERSVVLVGYREQFEKTKHIRWRAYWIDLQDHYSNSPKPVFVDPADYPGLTPIPLLAAGENTNSIPQIGYAAMEILPKPGFDLWKEGQFIGRYSLPVYEDTAPATAGTLATTPGALVVDAVIVVLVAAGVVAALYLSSLGDD